MKEIKTNDDKNQHMQSMMEAIISSAGLMCYEYDKLKHTSTCVTEKNLFKLPKIVTNFPESLRSVGLVHPDDVEIFIQTVHGLDTSRGNAYCEIRMKKDENYRWYSCIFAPYPKKEREKELFMITVTDISDHMELIREYKTHMQTLIDENKDSLSVATINITDNSFELVHAVPDICSIANNAKNLDELFENVGRTVVGENSQREYLRLFARQYLIDSIMNGASHIEFEHQRYIGSDTIEWMLGVVDLIKNPVTGDITGVYYGKSIHDSYMKALLLKKMLHKDYVMAIVVNSYTEKYNLIYDEKHSSGETNNDFWKDVPFLLQSFCMHISIEDISNHLEKQKVLMNLKRNKDFSWTFDGGYKEAKARFIVNFSYLDNSEEYILLSLRNITDQVLVDKLRYDSEHDALTKLYNRNKVFGKCRNLLNTYSKEQFAMLHFDIKHFRLYNTFFGDEVGDKLLCDVADMFRRMDEDYEYWAYGRVEADVFCVFFPINQNKYQKHLEDLLYGLEGYRADFLIEPAIGIYMVTDRTMPIEAMFTRATIAAKEVVSGRTNQVLFYTEEMEERLLNEQMIVNEMQNALLEEQYQVYLQPKYSLHTNKIVGAEALVRWNHPRYGIISPIKFIPVYEKNGFIAKLDRYMWEHVCQLLRKWMDEGKTVFPISVNVSRVSMYNQSTAEYINQLVQEYDIEPYFLELELTETTYMDEPEEMQKQLKELQKAGFKILMDDFGSGYSSLNTLREMPVDILKLDMNFLPIDLSDSRGKIILNAVLNMSKDLELPVIAEGVETVKQAEFLQSIGCEYVQGYLYARPMPAKEYEQILLEIDKKIY